MLRTLVLALFAAAHVGRCAADAVAEKKRVDWTMCSALCGAAKRNRMIIAPDFTMECHLWPQNDGVLRILDRYGLQIHGYQACAYGAGNGVSPKPLRISQVGNIWDQKYKLDFTRAGSSKKASVEVHLTKGLPTVR
eukprot:gb/GFBE01054240.1/.p1 GENE.gb/GFBE01054240.1/~~gb/GFBE01054240.1/.p1  ORF type:complete len:136 (+),score=32.18 gb/GFBE01054240.1/:1-408(+)